MKKPRPAIASPQPFVVVCQSYSKDSDQWFQHRVGSASSQAAARAIIDRDVKAAKESYGGLIAPVGSANRHYAIYQITAMSQVAEYSY